MLFRHLDVGEDVAAHPLWQARDVLGRLAATRCRLVGTSGAACTLYPNGYASVRRARSRIEVSQPGSEPPSRTVFALLFLPKRVERPERCVQIEDRGISA